MIERAIEIKNKLGLHARAAAKLVHTAARFKSDIKIRKGDEEVDGKSILGILLLAAGRGSSIVIKALCLTTSRESRICSVPLGNLAEMTSPSTSV